MAHYIRKKDDPFVHIATPALLTRNDFFECDINGKFLSGRPVGGMTPAEIEEIAPNITMPSQMDEFQLEEFALEKFGVDLDRRRSLVILQAQVDGLINGTLSVEDVKEGRFEPEVVEDEEEEEVVEEEEEPTSEAKIPALPNDLTVKGLKEFAKEYKIDITYKVGTKKADFRKQLEDLIAEANKE